MTLKTRVAVLIRSSRVLVLCLRGVQALITPRHRVGAIGAVFDEQGRVLIVEHLFRTDFPWGLPGGWIEPGEDPAETVRRECREELQIRVDVRSILSSGLVPVLPTSGHARHIGLTYYCRSLDDEPVPSAEILSIRWVDPLAPRVELAPFQLQAIELGRQAFERERSR